ncbi:TRAP transporter small permease subunit [Sporosarcina sp. FSL K6-1540]|uniref:TRAP transporter small permease n=1 Tax=Sporosarcina sp. FSL K6-1540 TaxID=2921555 RepID=UPI00315A19F8
MKKVLDSIANVYLIVALLCMATLISVLTAEIVLRYFFSHSMVWSQELFSILICWITFLGFGKIVVDRQDISITYLVQKLSKEKQRIVMIINSVLLLVISSLMLFYSTKLTISHLEKTTTIMKAASAWFYSPLVLLLFLVVLTSAHHIYLAYKSQLGLFSAEEEE